MEAPDTRSQGHVPKSPTLRRLLLTTEAGLEKLCIDDDIQTMPAKPARSLRRMESSSMGSCLPRDPSSIASLAKSSNSSFGQANASFEATDPSPTENIVHCILIVGGALGLGHFIGSLLSWAQNQVDEALTNFAGDHFRYIEGKDDAYSVCDTTVMDDHSSGRNSPAFGGENETDFSFADSSFEILPNEEEDGDEWGHFTDFQEPVEDDIIQGDPFHSLLRGRSRRVSKLSSLEEESGGDS